MMDIGIDILVVPESRGQVESLKYEWGSRRVVFAGVPPPNNAQPDFPGCERAPNEHEHQTQTTNTERGREGKPQRGGSVPARKH